MRKLHFK